MRNFYSLLSAVLLTVLFPYISFSNNNSVFSDTSATNPPNIVFILIDDMGWDVFGNYPDITGIKASTPHIDALTRDGITFLNFWTNPVCAPTRASLLTGKYSFRTGVGGVQTTPPSVLDSKEIIIQKYIKDKTNDKYATALIGKWHLSSRNDLTAPENFGINYFSGLMSGGVSDYYDWTQITNGVQGKKTTYITTELVNNSINWIKEQNKPFFLWLALNAPHTPFHRPPLNLIEDQSLSDNTASINANKYTYYLAAIEAMDKEIGRLIASLTPAQKENTVFIIMGDNGTPRQVAQKPYTANGTKGTLFQGGINTPFIISGKNVNRKNAIENSLVQAQDLFPTFASIAGIETSKYQDGISITPLFNRAIDINRTFVYTEQFGHANSRMDGYTIRNKDYKLIHLDNGTEYLYKINTDPFEKVNLLTNILTTDAQENLNQLKVYKANL